MELDKHIKKSIDKLISDGIHQSGDFNSYGPMYLGTNESFRGMMPRDIKLTGAHVLSVTSSGDIPLEFARSGAKVVDCFDINHFAKYMMQLKIAALRSLEQNEYQYFFSKHKSLLHITLYRHKIRHFLGREAMLFWDYIYEVALEKRGTQSVGCYIAHSGLFESMIPEYRRLSEQDSYLRPDNYEKLKTIIKNKSCKFNYIDDSIVDVSSDLKRSDYQVIYLSNIAEYIPNPTIKNLKNFRLFIEETLEPHLLEDGVMVVAYLCQQDHIHRHIAIHDPYQLEHHFNDCEISSFPSVGNSAMMDRAVICRKRKL